MSPAGAREVAVVPPTYNQTKPNHCQASVKYPLAASLLSPKSEKISLICVDALGVLDAFIYDNLGHREMSLLPIFYF